MALLRCALIVAALATVAHAGRLEVGDRVPDVTLTDWSGRPVSLADFRGRPVCLDFWASWCIPCRTALPALDAVARRHPNAVVLAVNIDRDRQSADRFLTERLSNPALTLVHDPGGTLMANLGAAGMPALYLIDREGVVRQAESGYDPAQLPTIERALEHLETRSEERR
jgi:thiol-disulfide isomerase/thioredoxin